MTKTLIKNRYNIQKSLKGGCYSCKEKEVKKSNNVLPPEIQTFKDKLLSGNGFMIYK